MSSYSDSEESYDSEQEEYLYRPRENRGLADFVENEDEQEIDLHSSFDELQMRRQKGISPVHAASYSIVYFRLMRSHLHSDIFLSCETHGKGRFHRAIQRRLLIPRQQASRGIRRPFETL